MSKLFHWGKEALTGVFFLLLHLHLKGDLVAFEEWETSGKRYLDLKLLNCNNKNERKIV